MSRILVGRFELDIRSPYPCWVDVRVDGESVATLHHKELRELHFAIEQAMREARLKLKTDKDEV